jgi:hypothetical protein
MISAAGAAGPYRLPVNRLFWLPIGLSALLMLVVLVGLVAAAWHGLERVRPVQTHLDHIARIQDMGLSMERTLLDGLRGARIDPADLDRLRSDLSGLAAMDDAQHPETAERLKEVAQGLDLARVNPVDGLVESLSALRQVLAMEREYHERLLNAVAEDTETELRLAIALLAIVPLAGGALLLLLRARIKHPLDDLGDLLGRLATRDYRPVEQSVLTGSAALVQPVFHSYNALVSRLQALETEHRVPSRPWRARCARPPRHCWPKAASWPGPSAWRRWGRSPRAWPTSCATPWQGSRWPAESCAAGSRTRLRSLGWRR